MVLNVGSDTVDERRMAHPIHRLPDELLAMVFLEWLDSSNRPFWGAKVKVFSIALYAASVCSRWRHVALTTPALWRVVDIDLSRVKVHNGKRHKRWTEYAETCLARAGAVKLDVSISGCLHALDAAHAAGAAAPIGRCLLHARRIDAEVGISDCATNNVFLDFLGGDAPHLEYFRLGLVCFTEHRVQRPVKFFTSAPRLREFNGSAPGPSMVWAPNSNFPSLVRSDMAAQRLEATHLQLLLTHAPNLRALSLAHVVLNAEETPAKFSLVHDKLQELSLRIAEGPNYSVLRTIRLPGIHTAAIDVGLHPADTATGLLQHTLVSVEQLTLSCGADALLLPGLAALTRLKRLILYGYDQSAEQFFDAVAQGEIVPMLEELGLTWRVPRDSTHHAIVRLARARGPQGRTGRVVLRSIQVNYPPSPTGAFTLHTADPALERFRLELKGVLTAVPCLLTSE